MIEETDVNDLKQWCIAVGQEQGNKALSLTMSPVVATHAAFEEWAFHHVNSYLEPREEPHTSQAPSPAAASPSWDC